MLRVRRMVLVGLLVGACAGAEIRFDPSPSCSYRTDRAEVEDAADAGSLRPGERPVSIALGQRHGCAVFGAGQVRCWGANDLGQLGPIGTPSRGRAHEYDDLAEAYAVVAGGAHSCAVTIDGIWCWGNDRYGQLGPSSDGSGAPARVMGLRGDLSGVTAGLFHGCAVWDQEVWCWGDNRFGQLGHELADVDPVPRRVEGLPPVSNLAAGAFHTCAGTGDPMAPIGPLADGEVWCWGRDEHGELGDGEAGGFRATPAPVPGISGLGRVSLFAGAHHTCAVDRDGAWCWGRGRDGELAQGRLESSATPVASEGFFSFTASGSADLSLRMAPDGHLVWTDGPGHGCSGLIESCWGHNADGQLGDGTTVTRPSPVPFPSLDGVAEIAAGGASTCAIDWSDHLWCWGDNDFGQLGYDGPGSTVPIQVHPEP